MGELTALGAVALGARFIEKHVTISNSDEGPDHAASLEISALPEFVRRVRQMRIARGSGIKIPGISEAPNRPLIRKGIVFVGVEAKPGYVLAERDLMCKRPLLDDSVLPADLEHIIGRRVCRPLTYDQPIKWSDIE
jgi:sialic acid synthase SpsE